MSKVIDKCLNCTLPDCVDCLGTKKDEQKAANKEYCKEYYQRHKKECIERTKRNRMKKRIAERGYDMAIYI